MASPREQLDRLESFGTRLGLDNTRRLLARLGQPQSRVTIVLVAGTNGKGSTAALLAAMASAAGYRTGLYTSPHLETVRERIRVDGRAIADDELDLVLHEVLAAARADGEPATTYFEALTCAALTHFDRTGVDLAVLEVGLGGRLDATNATEPVLSVITEIALDHREHLGETIEEVAAEKAGILRPGAPAVAWVSDPAARRALAEHAAELAATLRFANDECAFESEPGENDLDLVTGVCRYRLRAPLSGAHQLANLGLAVFAAEELAGAGWDRIGLEAIWAGISRSHWPGRLEWVALPGGGSVLLDGAHNPHAATALASYLEALPAGYTLVFGAIEGKEVAEMLPPLAARADRVVLTTPAFSRAVDPAALPAYLPGRAPVVVPRAADALELALRGPEPVVVSGSLYLVGELRSELTRRFGVPTPAADIATYSESQASRSSPPSSSGAN